MRGYVNIALLIASVKGLWNNRFIRYSILTVAFILVLVFSLHLYGNNRYQEGVAYQKSEYELVQKKLKEEYQNKLAEADKKITDLNTEIAAQKADYLKLKLERERQNDKIKSEVKEYAKTIDGAKHCVGSDWVRIYKNSLPN